MKPRFSPERAKRPKQQTGKAFTLTELLLVLLTVSFLAPLVLLTVAASRPNTAAIHCQNNHRQLVRAHGHIPASIPFIGTSTKSHRLPKYSFCWMSEPTALMMAAS